jgi:hypothetical protein
VLNSRALTAAATAALTLAAFALWYEPPPAAVEAARPPPVEACAPGELPVMAAVDPSPLVGERTEVASAPSSAVVQRRALPPIRAHVHLRGVLREAHDLGADLDLQLRPLAAPEPANDEDATGQRRPALGQMALDIGSGSFAHELPAEWQLPEDDARDGALGSADEPPGLALHASSDGTLDDDVTELFADPEQVPQLLVLEVRHPNFEPRCYVIAARAGLQRIDAVRLASEPELEIRVDVTLVPRCVVRGQAWARKGGAGAIRIEAWNVQQGHLTGLSAHDSVVGPDDTFELALAPDRRYAIVALADGFVPTTTVVYTIGALDLWIGSLVLDDGEAIDGHVALDEHLFGGKASLFLAPDVYERRDVFGPAGLCWNGAAFIPESVTATTDARGNFELAGLVPGRYRLRLGIDRSHWTEMDPVFDVHAPSSALELRAPLVRVTWEFEYQQRALERHAFRVRGVVHDESEALETDALGRASAWLLEGEPYVLEVPMTSPSTARTSDWTYGKVVPWHRSETFELIAMGWND